MVLTIHVRTIVTYWVCPILVILVFFRRVGLRGNGNGADDSRRLTIRQIRLILESVPKRFRIDPGRIEEGISRCQ